MAETEKLVDCLKQVIELEMTKDQQNEALIYACICRRRSNLKNKLLFLAFVLKSTQNEEARAVIKEAYDYLRLDIVHDNNNLAADIILTYYLGGRTLRKRASV